MSDVMGIHRRRFAGNRARLASLLLLVALVSALSMRPVQAAEGRSCMVGNLYCVVVDTGYRWRDFIGCGNTVAVCKVDVSFQMLAFGPPGLPGYGDGSMNITGGGVLTANCAWEAGLLNACEDIAATILQWNATAGCREFHFVITGSTGLIRPVVFAEALLVEAIRACPNGTITHLNT